MASIVESSTDNDSDDRSIGNNDIKHILDGSQIHPYINTRDARFKISDCINQAKIECKGAELSVKRMGKGLHKLFKAIANKLNN